MENQDRTAEFVTLFAENSRRIYVFVRTLVPNQSDADEVFQEACKVLWAKFDKFQPNTNFFAWASSVARFEALALRRRRGLENRVFSDQFYTAVEECADRIGDDLDRQYDALADCFQKLDDRQQDLVERMYRSDATTKSVAASFGRSANAIYKAMRRIHQLLFDCIQKQLATEG